MKNFTNKFIACFTVTFIVVLLSSTLNAQETKFRDQAWRYGLNLGLNYNSASLGWQDLHAPFPNFVKPDDHTKDHSNGTGYGLYGGIFGEYLSESWWGIQLRASWDTRDAKVTDTYAIPNTEFDTKMTYLSFEPALRIDQHFIPNLGITIGGLVAANIHGTYNYKAGGVADPNNPIKVPDRPQASLGVTGGLAYDIELSRTAKTSMFLSPFFDYSWIAAQRKSVLTSTQNSANDIWSTQTFRVGLRLSWEFRNPDEERIVERIVYVNTPYVAPAGKKVFVGMPEGNTITTKSVNGYFPIHPYVFFNKNSKEIPSRYIMLSKTDAQNFKETDLENFKKGDLTVKETNMNQLMTTYYNIMNIYGYRMKMNPNVKLTLRGSDPEERDGESYANAVKNYLVNNFGIEPSRIKIEVEPPIKPSGSALTDPAFTGYINDENRRVHFVFSDQDMYKPVPYTILDESSIDNDMIYSINNDVKFRSWSLTITGENKTMNFGPFKTNWQRVNPAPLMRGIEQGNFNAKVVITMQDGSQITEDTDFKLYKNKEMKNASRYLMIFDYNKSDPVMVYETKIRKEIAPGMNVGNTVIVHGHTDIIGNEAANQRLSQERAEQAKRIVVDQLRKDDKKIDVQALGIGQTSTQYTFDNQNPEGRMYNRNVFVEIIQ